MIGKPVRMWIFALAALPACECETPVTLGDSGGGDSATVDGGDASKDGSIACYVATQFTCKEYPAPTAAQLTDVPSMCSSVSGVLSQPAACPAAGYGGKCTRPSSEGYVERFYAGADLPYAQDFCVNTAHGVWSTAF